MIEDPSTREAIAKLEHCAENAVRAVTAATGDAIEESHVLRDLLHRARKLKKASQRPACLGFFGPSQAGKSFLVGALLSHELGSLTVLSKERELDFLKEINPAKGVESTGVVTRFTTRSLAQPLVKGDFYCRLLSLEVLLEAMATGFLVECTSPLVDPARVAQCLRDARLQEGPAAPAIYREAWETVWHNLAKKYQDRHPYLNELRRQSAMQGNEWKDSIRSAAGWAHAFSLLWGGPGYASDLDRLMRDLIDGLEAVGHAEGIEIELENVQASSDGVSVIDAACLNSIGREGPPVTAYVAGTGRAVKIAPGVLSGLIAELYLLFREKQGSLLERADILDFPGGRALKGINGFGPEELNQNRLENAIEVFKRGKLTFLFEQFSIDREITALCLCSPGPTKPEAIQLQTQVEQWLKIRHGAKTPTTQHEIERPSLFIALTKYDMSLGALRSDNAMDRWDSRVQEACVDFWARSHNSWIVNWGSRGRCFDNMFWIRNPYADQMRTLAPGSDDYQKVKEGYFASKAVTRHIHNPEEKWLAVEGEGDMGLPKSGVPLLAEHFRAKMAENVKARELADEAIAIHSELATVLKALTPSRDEEEERQRIVDTARALVESIQRGMNRACSGAVFGELMTQIVVDESDLESEVRSIYGAVAPMSIKTSDKVKKVLVHVMKWWVAQAGERVRRADLGVAPSTVDHFVREICTSKKLLPILGRAVFPYFSRTVVDPALIANIMRVTVSDAMLDLFTARERRTPAAPIRLSYSEVLTGDGDADAIDWGDVDFEEEVPKSQVAGLEIIFAGNRYWKGWGGDLERFYLENRGSRPAMTQEDPRAKVLGVLLKEVEAIHVRPRP